MKSAAWMVGAAVALAAMGSAYFAGWNEGTRDMAPVAKRVDELERQLVALQDAYLTGNPQSRQSIAQSLGYRAVRRGQGPIVDDPSRVLTEKAVQAKTQQVRAALDRDYSGEPLDPAWAGTSVNAIEDAIVEVASEGGPTPQATQVDCRSHTCRINLNLNDSGEIGSFVDNLLVRISGTLPNTRMVQHPAPNGRGMEVIIFATTKAH